MNLFKKFSGLVCATAIAGMLVAGCAAPAAPAPAPAPEAGTEAPAAEAEAAAPEAPAAETNALPAADVAEQGYDHYDKAMTYLEAEEALGPLPKYDGEIKLGFVCKTFENEFWRMQKEGAEFAAKALQDAGYNVTIDVRAAQVESDEQGQLALLNDMVNKEYTAILCSPISDGNLVPGIENAVKAGIDMTVVMDAFIPQIDCTVGAWHYKAGEQGAEWISNKVGGAGKVAVLQGLPKSPAARARTEGFQDWVAANNPNLEIVAVQNADWDRMKSKEITDIWLKQHPDLKGIYANNDTMAMGALEAVKSANSECVIVGTDGTSEAVESIKAGELDATVDFFPFQMAQIGVEMQIRKLAGQEVPKVIYAPQAVRDIDNINKSVEEIVGFTGINF